MSRVTRGPRLSDDPRYTAMRAGQAVHPDAAEFGYGPVTYTRTAERLENIPADIPAILEVATVG